MKLRLAVLDMVGTTIQSGDEVPSSFREAFRSVGIDLSDEEIAEFRGRSKRDAISALVAKNQPTVAGDTEQLDSLYARFQDSLRAAYRARARAIPGAEETMRLLRQARVEVVLITGLDRDTARLLLTVLGWDALGLSGVVTGDDVERGRPAPDLIFGAMNLTGIEEAQSVLVVGDTTADLEAAAAAQVGWSIGVLSGAHPRVRLDAYPHSAIFESVDHLVPWLERSGVLGGRIFHDQGSGDT